MYTKEQLIDKFPDGKFKGNKMFVQFGKYTVGVWSEIKKGRWTQTDIKYLPALPYNKKLDQSTLIT